MVSQPPSPQAAKAIVNNFVTGALAHLRSARDQAHEHDLGDAKDRLDLLIAESENLQDALLSKR
jgi:hypothetical protein